MLLPIDQGIEHGPRDFFPNPASKDPDYQFRLAAEAGYSALACQIGLAEKYYPDYAGKVPLILKVNGKTDVPSCSKALSTCNASVEDGGSARRRRDRLHAVRRLAAPGRGPRPAAGRPRGMRPLRHAAGRLVLPARRSGRCEGRPNSFYAIDYAARMAMEMGADIVKLNMPKIDPDKDKDAPAPYGELEFNQQEAIQHCVASAGRGLVVLSGGSKVDDETVLNHTREVMEAGGSGVIFGRNVWQREWSEALEIIEPDQGELLSNVRRIP